MHLKIEADKYYRTRSGQKAYVIGALPHLMRTGIEWWVGIIFGDPYDVYSGRKTQWSILGRYENDGDAESEKDLVATWADPRAEPADGNHKQQYDTLVGAIDRFMERLQHPEVIVSAPPHLHSCLADALLELARTRGTVGIVASKPAPRMSSGISESVSRLVSRFGPPSLIKNGRGGEH